MHVSQQLWKSHLLELDDVAAPDVPEHAWHDVAAEVDDERGQQVGAVDLNVAHVAAPAARVAPEAAERRRAA
jgi:hypothetical protein